MTGPSLPDFAFPLRPGAGGFWRAPIRAAADASPFGDIVPSLTQFIN